jgi:hypothetical protein
MNERQKVAVSETTDDFACWESELDFAAWEGEFRALAESN